MKIGYSNISMKVLILAKRLKVLRMVTLLTGDCGAATPSTFFAGPKANEKNRQNLKRNYSRHDRTQI